MYLLYGLSVAFALNSENATSIAVSMSVASSFVRAYLLVFITHLPYSFVKVHDSTAKIAVKKYHYARALCVHLDPCIMVFSAKIAVCLCTTNEYKVIWNRSTPTKKLHTTTRNFCSFVVLLSLFTSIFFDFVCFVHLLLYFVGI